MKIAFLNIYNGLVDRGAERSTHELASYLSKKHEVYLIAGGENKNKTVYKTYKIRPLFSRQKDTSFSIWRKFYLDCWSLQILIFTFRALPFLVKKNFDIIIPVNGGWQTVLCQFLTWLQRGKMVIIGRAGIGRDDAWNLFWKPDTFVALTRHAFVWAEKRAKNVNIVYIPNGVNLAQFCPNISPAQIGLKSPIILCACALNPNKQVELTIRAVAKLKEGSLLVLGEGLRYQYLYNLGNELLGKDRFMVTAVSHDDMPKYYSLAKIFTLVSRSGEAFGNVYLEAMACNLPVVATDDETRREIIGEAGLFVAPGDTQEYVRMLETALRKDFGNIPREQAEKFSWDRIILKYEKMLKR